LPNVEKILEKKEVKQLVKEYLHFLNECKTERETISYWANVLRKEGYKEDGTKKDGKVFFVKNHKSLIAVKFPKGKVKSLKIIASHGDSPRIDLKPQPLYEDKESNLVLLDTHYYGGIKKYHWVNIPLSLRGVLVKKGRKIAIKEGPLVISDLLPHLAKEQMVRKAEETIKGEELDVLFGSLPLERIKEKLKEKYGLEEKDFARADLELVPDFEAKEVGFDKSMIAGYGQDDRICVFTSMKAFLNANVKDSAIVCYVVDKEEIGSEGNTSAQSAFLEKTLSDLGLLPLLYDADVISADVDGALNPIYKSAFSIKNTGRINMGPTIRKYTGRGGKFVANEAHAEYVDRVFEIFGDIPFQVADRSKIDQGGGGTVALFFARYGANVVDIGPPILSMHSTYEISGKADLYFLFLFYERFFES
jgi:aspartyl aminopeptidase